MNANEQPPLEHLDTLNGYQRYFMDAGYWESYVREVCGRHPQVLCRAVRSGLPGTYPTFIVDERWVVKLFGRLFDGALAFDTERQVSELLEDHPIPAPALIARGRLFEGSPDWSWPYLIFEFIPGVSIGEVYRQIALCDKLELARSLGAITRHLHSIPVPDTPILQPTWDAYSDLLDAQRARCQSAHRAWNTLPVHLIEQIGTFLLPLDELIDHGATPHLIHADLTADHVLGRLDGGTWTTLGIIDFGDAMIGNLLYELSALHMDLFRRDKRLLRAYLDAYGLDEQSCQALPRRAMSVALLHRFNVLYGLTQSHLRVRDCSSLDELAVLLWDVSAPGLDD